MVPEVQERGFQLEDQPSVAVDEECLLELIQKHHRRSTRALTYKLECHSRGLEKTWRYGAWIAHDLGVHQLWECMYEHFNFPAELLLPRELGHWRREVGHLR